MIAYLQAPFGWLEIEASDKTLQRISHVRKPTAKQQALATNRSPLLKKTCRQLQEYFQGKRKSFDLPLDISAGTPFQQQTWQALLQIDYGKTASYKTLAGLVGNPKAMRAVGGANNKNPLSIVIPCHRVIGADGSLTGYAGGLERKRWLLALEGIKEEENKEEGCH